MNGGTILLLVMGGAPAPAPTLRTHGVSAPAGGMANVGPRQPPRKALRRPRDRVLYLYAGRADAEGSAVAVAQAATFRLAIAAGPADAAGGCTVTVDAPVVPWWVVWRHGQKRLRQMEEEYLLGVY